MPRVSFACHASVLSLVWFVAAGALGGVDPPFDLRCGFDASAAGLAGADGVVLPDTAFSIERGYGFIGGEAGRLARGAVRGAPFDAPITWREGPTKYSFRVPSGRYVVRVGMVETEVASAGRRIFDVVAEDEVALARVDIAEQAGDFAWLERAFEVGVYDGWLDIHCVPLTGDRVPRLSQLVVLPAVEREGTPPAPPAPTLSGRSGPLSNRLEWSAPSLAGSTAGARAIAGYGLFRSDSRDGPFETLSDEPIRVRQWIDERVESGREYFYRVRAYGVEGGQSELSPPLAISAENIVFRGLTKHEIAIAPDALARIGVCREPAELAPAELVVQDRRFPVDIGYSPSPERWQLRKSLVVDMSFDRYRVFQKRAELDLSAEAGDWSQLRERLASEAALALDLPAPRVEPVTVLVNGTHFGLRFDIEDIDAKFRQRSRLDRVGLLARLEGDDHWRADWRPRGVRVGKSGDVAVLADLVAQINRLHEGEIEDLFVDSFYTERAIVGLAFAAARGELDPPPSALFALRDSRNGRWELFRQHHRSGDWGLRDWTTEVAVPAGDELDRVLFPGAQRAGVAARSEWLVLWTRFFHCAPLRAKYLARLEEMLTGALAPERFDAIVERAFAQIRASVLDEVGLWPFDGGESFLAGPERIGEAHRRRVDALRERIAVERAREDEPLAIDRFLIVPRDGTPWIELRNRSTAGVELHRYRLSDSFAATGRVVATRTTVAPGGVHRFELPADWRGASRGAGGQLVLWRQLEPGRFVIADFVYYGHQTAGFAYGRDTLAPSGWRFFAAPDAPAEPGDAVVAREGTVVAATPAAPTPYYVWGVDARPNGDLTVSFRARGPRDDGPSAVSRVELRFRAAGRDAAESVPMVWDDKRYEHSLSLEHDERRERTEFWFVATSASGIERAYPLGAPEITFALPVLPQLEINEVCPRPGGDPGAPGEFIEIYNASGEPVALDGLHLSDDRRRPTKWRITEDTVLAPKSYVVFFADGLNRGRHTNFKLSNSGEFIGLFGRSEEGNLQIDAAAFRGVPLGHSWGRKQDGTGGFRAWKDPTPGARNLPRIPNDVLERARRGEAATGEDAGPGPGPGAGSAEAVRDPGER